MHPDAPRCTQMHPDAPEILARIQPKSGQEAHADDFFEQNIEQRRLFLPQCGPATRAKTKSHVIVVGRPFVYAGQKKVASMPMQLVRSAGPKTANADAIFERCIVRRQPRDQRPQPA